MILGYIFILESNEVLYTSPPQASRHAIIRQETNLFSHFLDSIRETLTDKKNITNSKRWFTKKPSMVHNELFVHHSDLNSKARKSFRPKISDNETI